MLCTKWENYEGVWTGTIAGLVGWVSKTPVLVIVFSLDGVAIEEIVVNMVDCRISRLVFTPHRCTKASPNAARSAGIDVNLRLSNGQLSPLPTSFVLGNTPFQPSPDSMARTCGPKETNPAHSATC